LCSDTIPVLVFCFFGEARIFLPRYQFSYFVVFEEKREKRLQTTGDIANNKNGKSNFTCTVIIIVGVPLFRMLLIFYVDEIEVNLGKNN
jgi:hypothetical protein